MSNNCLKTIALGAAAALLMSGWSVAAQAQTCTITNWDGGAVNDTALFAGSPASGNRRYAGPCSMAVTLNTGPAYVVDNSPAAEQAYIARFYFNANGNTDEMQIFAANDSDTGEGGDVFQLWFNRPTAGAAQLVIAAVGGVRTINVPAGDLRSTGWNSFEVVWEASATATIALSANGNTDLIEAGDTSADRIRSALLGLVGFPAAITSATPVFFDDFDSRRVSRPGRLCRGLTDENRNELNLDDVLAIYDEFVSQGQTPAAGQPDYDENGSVDLDDVLSVYDRFVNQQGDCDLNR